MLLKSHIVTAYFPQFRRNILWNVGVLRWAGWKGAEASKVFNVPGWNLNILVTGRTFESGGHRIELDDRKNGQWSVEP